MPRPYQRDEVVTQGRQLDPPSGNASQPQRSLLRVPAYEVELHGADAQPAKPTRGGVHAAPSLHRAPDRGGDMGAGGGE